jgi:hypothetical protein
MIWAKTQEYGRWLVASLGARPDESADAECAGTFDPIAANAMLNWGDGWPMFVAMWAALFNFALVILSLSGFGVSIWRLLGVSETKINLALAGSCICLAFVTYQEKLSSLRNRERFGAAIRDLMEKEIKLLVVAADRRVDRSSLREFWMIAANVEIQRQRVILSKEACDIENDGDLRSLAQAIVVASWRSGEDLVRDDWRQLPERLAKSMPYLELVESSLALDRIVLGPVSRKTIEARARAMVSGSPLVTDTQPPSWLAELQNRCPPPPPTTDRSL